MDGCVKKYCKLTYDEGGNICNSQVGEVHIGGSPHVLISHKKNAGGEVVKDTNDEEDAVDDGEWGQGCQVDMGVTKCRLNEIIKVVIANSVF